MIAQIFDCKKKKKKKKTRFSYFWSMAQNPVDRFTVFLKAPAWSRKSLATLSTWYRHPCLVWRHVGRWMEVKRPHRLWPPNTSSFWFYQYDYDSFLRFTLEHSVMSVENPVSTCQAVQNAVSKFLKEWFVFFIDPSAKLSLVYCAVSETWNR